MKNKFPIFNIFDYLTKELKYGLMTKGSIEIYELGFSDREIAKEISNYLKDKTQGLMQLLTVKELIKEEREGILNILEKYPSIYKYQLDLLLRK